MELVDVLDENGNLTGKVMDKDEVHEKNFFHNEVTVFIMNDKKEILLQKRSPNKKYGPNLWGLCSGHVDAGEKLDDAIRREAMEEVGLVIDKDDLHPIFDVKKFVNNRNSHFTHFYYTRCNKDENEFVIQEEELTEVKWFSIDEIIDMIKNKPELTTQRSDRLWLYEELRNIF